MTLKKDAMVCVTLAGIVLLMAGFSRLSSSQAPPESKLQEEASLYDKDLYQLYVDAIQANSEVHTGRSRQLLDQARQTVSNWYRQSRLQAPIDYYRAAAILATSTDRSELSLAYELSLDALSKGVRAAKRLVLEAQDRQLLAEGNDQRYGTQSSWNGKQLSTVGSPDAQISPELQNELGLHRPVTEANLR